MWRLWRHAPVCEVTQDSVNVLLADFFSPAEMGDRVCEALEHLEKMQPLRDNARQTIVEHYAQSLLLPKQVQLLEELIANPS